MHLIFGTAIGWTGKENQCGTFLLCTSFSSLSETFFSKLLFKKMNYASHFKNISISCGQSTRYVILINKNMFCLAEACVFFPLHCGVGWVGFWEVGNNLYVTFPPLVKWHLLAVAVDNYLVSLQFSSESQTEIEKDGEIDRGRKREQDQHIV